MGLDTCGPLVIPRAIRRGGDVGHGGVVECTSLCLPGLAGSRTAEDELASRCAEDGAVVDESHAQYRESVAQQRLGWIVMTEVHRDDLRRIGARTDVGESVEHHGQCRHVEVTGAVVEVISEGLLDEDDVVRRIAHCLDVVDQPRVGRVEQPSARGAGDVVEHSLGCHLIRRAALMARRDHGRAVGASRCR